MSEQGNAATDGRADAAPRAFNEMTRSDGNRGGADRPISDRVAPHYRQEGNAFHSAYRPGKIDFIDRGDRMHAHTPVSTFTVRSMSEIAEARGWQSLAVSGSEAFRQTAYIEAKTRGIEVSGYEPTQKDAAILERRSERKAAQDNPMVRAFVDAESKKDRDAAMKARPPLKEAFAIEAAAKVFANEKIDSKKSAQDFVDRIRDSVAIALHTVASCRKSNSRSASGKPRERASDDRLQSHRAVRRWDLE